MSLLTASDIDQALNAVEWFYGNPWDALAYEDFDHFDHLVIFGESYPFEVVATKTGNEGDWHTDTFVVIKVGNQFFRRTGYYASHDGMYLDGPTTEVEPTFKQVQVWESK